MKPTINILLCGSVGSVVSTRNSFWQSSVYTRGIFWLNKPVLPVSCQSPLHSCNFTKAWKTNNQNRVKTNYCIRFATRVLSNQNIDYLTVRRLTIFGSIGGLQGDNSMSVSFLNLTAVFITFCITNHEVLTPWGYSLRMSKGVSQRAIY